MVQPAEGGIDQRRWFKGTRNATQRNNDGDGGGRAGEDGHWLHSPPEPSNT